MADLAHIVREGGGGCCVALASQAPRLFLIVLLLVILVELLLLHLLLLHLPLLLQLPPRLLLTLPLPVTRTALSFVHTLA